MFELASNAIKLFMRGQLFRDSAAVLRAWLIGFVITVVLMLLLAFYVNAVAAAVVGGFAGGALMPILFRDLKYN